MKLLVEALLLLCVLINVSFGWNGLGPNEQGLRLTCKRVVDMKVLYVSCLELVDEGAGTLTRATRDEIGQMDQFVKQLNGDPNFRARNFIAGHAGRTILPTNGPTNVRLDTQTPRAANIQFQVGRRSKAQANIRFEQELCAGNLCVNNNREIDDPTFGFTDKQIKAMVQDGLDYSIKEQRLTRLQFRVLRVQKVKKQYQLRQAVTGYYGVNILEPITVAGRQVPQENFPRIRGGSGSSERIVLKGIPKTR